MSIPTALGVLTLVVGVPLNAYVAWRLWKLHRASPELRVLRERGIVETGILALVIVFGVVFVNNDLVPPILAFDDTKIVTRLTMFAVATVPASYWLWIYRGRR